ncbi:MAG: zinc-binding dehydrogenase [Bacteroidales bacterium]|nr:zinc-binding dehydrogenase [Bacteroidales bacterium]
MALLAGAGPMGLGAVDYALNCDRRPSLLVVTDIDANRLSKAASVFTVEYAAERGVQLIYLNTSEIDAVKTIRDISDNTGFDDVFVFAPVKSVVEQGDAILGFDGCLNFFAGPIDSKFSASLNFYNVHYSFTHLVGTSGGNTSDMAEALQLMKEGKINPAVMITHIGGLDSVVDTTLNLPFISGGKKLIYTNISMPLTAIDELGKLSTDNNIYKGLYEIVSENGNIWSDEAEKYLLANATPV